MVSSSPYPNTYPAGQSVTQVCLGFQVLSKTGLSVLNWPFKPEVDHWSHTGECKILERFQKVVCYLMLMMFSATLKTRICKITQDSTNYCTWRAYFVLNVPISSQYFLLVMNHGAISHGGKKDQMAEIILFHCFYNYASVLFFGQNFLFTKI